MKRFFVLLWYVIQGVSTISNRRALTLDYGEDNLETAEHHFSNTWAVHIEGGMAKAEEVAREHGFDVLGTLGSLKDHYHFRHQEVHGRSRRSAEHVHSKLATNPAIKWAQQQKILKRVKRGHEHSFSFKDPLFHDQWYLKNSGQTPCTEKLDINVLPTWKKNITGEGVVVTILDDGLEHDHPDLIKSYEPAASFDFNGNDHDPFPRYSPDNINKHGTRCAGEVAAAINNDICGVGVAYNAKIGGIRMLDGDVTDAVEAGSLCYNPLKIDIYSSSWGPDDDGKTVDGPGPLAEKAFIEGIRNGRQGLGAIFVWATGNGGRYNDYCSCDGYINSIYTVSIGAVDNCGRSPWYAEPCPGTLAVTYSSGVTSGPDKQIATTDLHHSCTITHTGTSAAAPLAAGIFALVLEANPRLTWRDLQHLIVQTSIKISPNDREWQTNAAGHHVNPKFGFGVLDTDGLVTAAMSPEWKTSPVQHVCNTRRQVEMKVIPPGGSVSSELYTSGCTGKPGCVSRLEHVRVNVTLRHMHRGGLIITLTSPSGIKSPLLRTRNRDLSQDGFSNWPFLTVFNWDENPTGTWTLTVQDTSGAKEGALAEWGIQLFGTCDAGTLNVTINETKVCLEDCKRGCPNRYLFAEKCVGCSLYCDCEIGECVPACADNLVTDTVSRHCRRATDFGNENYPIRLKTNEKTVVTKASFVPIPLSAKFTVIGFALAILLAFTGGIFYFVREIPKKSRENLRDVGYQRVKRLPSNCMVPVGGSEQSPRR